MPRKRKNRKNKRSTPQIDLHGIKHEDANIMVEDYVLDRQYDLPIKIITGNSNQMKKIVKDVLKKHEFSYYEGDFWNRGYIMVTS